MEGNRYLEYNIKGETYSRKLEYGTYTIPGDAENIRIIKSTPVKPYPEELPQSKKAKAQYLKLNDWRNKRKR